MKKRIRNILAMIVGLGPGVLFPFTAAYFMHNDDSDTLLLAWSVSLFMINIMVHAIEGNSVAKVGKMMGSGAFPSNWFLRRLSIRSLVMCVPFALVMTPAVLLIYGGSHVPSLSTLIVTTTVLVLVPLIGSVSAVYSGTLLAAGKTNIPIATQGFRSILPLALIGFLPTIDLPLISAFAVLGEMLRCLVLHLASRQLCGTAGTAQDVSDAAHPKDVYWQFFASTATQANPVVDRAFLAGAGAGLITAYELADKISFAVFQAVYNLFLLRYIGGWAQAAGVSRRTAYELFRRDLIRLFLLTLSGAITGSAAILVFVFLTPWVPEAWRLGFLWSLISLLAMPFAICVTALMRFLVMIEAQRPLFIASLIGLIVNFVADGLLFHLLGPVGIPIASVFTRASLACGMFFIASRVSRQEKASND